MTRTGLSWQAVARMASLFYDDRLHGGQKINFPHVPLHAVGIFWCDDFKQHRSPLEYAGYSTIFTTGCIYSGNELNYFRKAMQWHFMAEGDLTEITVSDFPEKGEDCTRFSAARQNDGTWSATLEAGPDANPVYREAFQCLGGQSAIAA